MVLVALSAAGAHAGQEYTIDTAHSQIGFSVKHMVISTVYGTFSEYTGKILYDAQDITQSSVEGVIKVASINTANARRDADLRSASFFDVATWPEILFKTRKIEKKGDHYLAWGDLTMHGITREIALDFEITGKITDSGGHERIGLTATGTLKRMDFGITWNAKLDNGGVVVSDEVNLRIDAEFVKKE